MRIANGYTFFWKQTPLSNWYVGAPFTVDGKTFRTSEHWMMYKKAELFGDTRVMDLLFDPQYKHPADAKILGREVTPFDKAKWDAVAKDMVFLGCRMKFHQNPSIKAVLMATKGTKLVEASPYDPIWGIGLEENDDRVLDPQNWLGLNWLGEVLDRVRYSFEADGLVAQVAREWGQQIEANRRALLAGIGKDSLMNIDPKRMFFEPPVIHVTEIFDVTAATASEFIGDPGEIPSSEPWRPRTLGNPAMTRVYSGREDSDAGVTEQGYGIITKDPRGRPVPLLDVKFGVESFLNYARENEDKVFKITRIGSEDEWADDLIAPMFRDAPTNCLFDDKWRRYLGDEKRAYWGTN